MTDEREERNERPISTADMVEAAEKPRREEERRDPEVASERRDEEAMQLLSRGDIDDFRSRWDSIQTRFVDEPRQSVEEADSLVAEVMRQIAQMFANERSSLEEQWTRGDDVSTEDLRVALQRYRSFFNRLLSLQ
jgi:hypothetical protein